MFDLIFNNIDDLEKEEPYCIVLFKEKDEDTGWLSSIMSGDMVSVYSRCEIFKKNNKFSDFKIFGDNFLKKKMPVFKEVKLSPFLTYKISDWIYSSELDRWFIAGEEPTIPLKSCDIMNDIDFISYFEPKKNDLRNFELDEKFYTITDIWVKTGNLQYCFDIALNNIEYDYKKFIDNIKLGKFSKFNANNSSFTKILVWNMDKKIRLIIQDYNDLHEVKEPINLIVDKKVFINKVENLSKSIAKKNKIIMASWKI